MWSGTGSSMILLTCNDYFHWFQAKVLLEAVCTVVKVLALKPEKILVASSCMTLIKPIYLSKGLFPYLKLQIVI